MPRGERKSPHASSVRFKDPPDFPAAPGSPTAKEWMPVAARHAYLDRVATAATTDALDALRAKPAVGTSDPPSATCSPPSTIDAANWSGRASVESLLGPDVGE